MPTPLTHPTILTDMMKGNITNVLAMIIGEWFHVTFWGSVTNKVLFPLTIYFKPRLQQRIQLLRCVLNQVSILVPPLCLWALEQLLWLGPRYCHRPIRNDAGADDCSHQWPCLQTPTKLSRESGKLWKSQITSDTRWSQGGAHGQRPPLGRQI